MTRHPLNPLMAFGLALASVVSWHVAAADGTNTGRSRAFCRVVCRFEYGPDGARRDGCAPLVNRGRARSADGYAVQARLACPARQAPRHAAGRTSIHPVRSATSCVTLSSKLPDGGREIILATDQPMSFWEIVNSPRSAQYPFTWVQFKMKPDGNGDGKLAVAARIDGEEADQLIEVEDFAIYPVRLQNIRSTKDRN